MGKATATADRGAARLGHVLPEYVVDRELGRGGMGVVYLGRHRRLDRSVAIKELPPSFAVDPAVRERFSTEAQTLAGLSHPHIVPIYDYVERDGICLIVMEQLPGGSVWDRFTTAGLTPPAACGVVMACCAALHYAHGKGVLHLDVKPDNLMFDAEAAVKVTDFGIARVITGDRTLGTVDGQVLGTPAYMSPEQARGDVLTPASDVYATGVMLYELLSGTLPWKGATTAGELLQQRLAEDPVPLRTSAPHVPEPLEDVVMAALSRDAAVRYQGAEDLGVAVGAACVAAWGPGWVDHAGVNIFGSERLARALRTTGAFGAVADRPVAPPLPATDSGAVLGARASGAGATVVTGPRARSGHETVVTGGQGPAVPGAGATVVTGGQQPVAPGATDTVVTGGQAPAAPRSHETVVTGGSAAEGAPRRHETVVTGDRGSTPPGAGATVATGGPVPPGGPAAPATVAAGAGGATPPVAPATAPPAEPLGDGDGPALRLPGLAEPLVPHAAPDGLRFDVVRAAADDRIDGVDLYRLEVADLIGVEDVLDPPRPPWPAVAWAIGLVVAAVLVALVGLGAPVRGEPPAPGELAVAGRDAAEGRRSLDLAEPVEVDLLDRRLAARVDEVELRFTYLGRAVASPAAPVREGRAVLDPGLAQRLVGGAAGAEVVVRSDGRVLRERSVAVDATQTWYLTVPAVGGLLLVLLGYANLESSLKPLRSGRTRRLSYVGAVLAGPPLAVGVVLLVGAVGLREPTVGSLATASVLVAAAGVPTVRARVGIARTRRVRQAVRRAERTLGVTARTTARPPAA